MLTDSEIRTLQNDKSYKKVIFYSKSKFLRDLLKTKELSKFKTDIDFVAKVSIAFLRSNLIRKELFESSSILLENLLNRNKNWKRTSLNVKYVCESQNSTYLWMRFDEPRVNCLFNRGIFMIGYAPYRDIIKTHSSITIDKDTRLAVLEQELKALHKETIKVIQARKVFDQTLQLRAEDVWDKNGEDIIDNILGKGKGGGLGLLPPSKDDDDDDISGKGGDTSNPNDKN
ncbi:MAG: hypothetical protein N4A72_20860 [Bacteroidales bacterium]|jgi:hypothetical protein|nr:hypothetical protein [Bacteroidales bacterium]